MAINKKLIHFKTKDNFDKEVANGNILDTSIIFIQDTKEISTHGSVYSSVNWGVIDENTDTTANTEVVDVLSATFPADGLTAESATTAATVSLLNNKY